MFILDKKYFKRVGITLWILSFIFLFAGVRFVLGSAVTWQIVAVHVIFSLLVGGIGALYTYFQLKAAFSLYFLGLSIGYIEMYRAFIIKLSGWGDLVGLLSMFMWTIIGLGTGILLELGVFLFRRATKKSR